MKAVFVIVFLSISSILINAQSCIQDTEFIKSCTIESGVFKPDMKIGFLEDCIKETYRQSKLFYYDSIPAEITKRYYEDNGLPQSQLKDLILTITGIENLPYRTKRPLTFLIADGNDGNRYRYYLSSTSDTLNPSASNEWCVYLVEEHERFSKLIGQTIYGKQNLWSEKTEDGEYKTVWGVKYSPLKVTGIIPWRGTFSGAYYIRFKPEDSEKEYYRYCENSEEFFNSIFTFCDPKDSFEDIKKKDWEAIQSGLPEAGMSKDMLTLTMGEPDNVSTHQTNKETHELWYYKNVAGRSYRILLSKDKVESISSSERSRWY
ncbi:MAG: hypothetical protein LBH12_06585 [Dysgonamonadaceae bacterium]|jgi:hypothetical protein|nr:hypothetical protein [Dysgonamonadaceae bacterium]